MKRAFRRIEERLPSHQGNALFELKKLFPNSLPLGTPPLGGGWVGFPCFYVPLSLKTCYSVFKQRFYAYLCSLNREPIHYDVYQSEATGTIFPDGRNHPSGMCSVLYTVLCSDAPTAFHQYKDGVMGGVLRHCETVSI